MANQTYGPVRPPVLDMEAREKRDVPVDGTARAEGTPPAEGDDVVAEIEAAPADVTQADATIAADETPAIEEAAPAGDPPHRAAPPPPLRPETAAARGGRTGLAIAGGAVGGLVLAYLLALAGLWPGETAASVDTTGLESRIAALESAPAPQAAATIVDDGDAEQIAALEQRIGALESAEAPSDSGATDAAAAAQESAAAAVAQAEGLAEEVAALQARLQAITSAASDAGGDASAAVADLSASLDQIADAVAAETEARTALAAQLAATETSFGERIGAAESALDGRITALETALADQPTVETITADRDRFAQWPSAVAALRGHVQAGTPFAEALETVTTLAPELTVPEAVSDAAASGIAGNAEIASTFATQIPAMLRAAPADPEAGWAQTLLNQAGAALALRPAGENAGEGPLGDLARAEAAVEAGDFAAARDALALLPEPMLAAAGDVPETIAARAEIDAFIDEAEAFSPEPASVETPE